MALYEFEGKLPRLGKDSYIHPEAIVIGDVVIGDGCYVGGASVLRADCGSIVIGDGTNIQDGCIIHSGQDTSAIIGKNNVIGHGAVLHGPMMIGEQNLIGMRATVLMGCELGDGCVIAAGSLVAPNTKISNRKMWMGVPAREIKDVSERIIHLTDSGVAFYRETALRSLKGMKRID
jgi:carbonic anhydrase/acetyltransferase-like protein (isoleucine patch superfamily)